MSFVAVAIGGSAVLGYVASSNATDAAAEASRNSTDAAARSAQLQYDLGKETLDFQRDYYSNTLKPMQERDMALREQLQSELLPGLRQQREFAAEQQQYYKDTFQPLERQMVSDAQNYDSVSNIQRRSGIAAANVNQQFSNAAGQNARLLSRYGINPNSSAFARENAKLTNAEALASAGAQTGAAFDTMDKAIALRAGAANFGRNMPNTAAQFSSISNQTAGTSSGISSAGVGNAVGAVGPMNTGSGIAMHAFNSAGNINNDAFRNNMSFYNSQMNGVSGLFQGIGNFASSKVGSNALSTFGDRLSASGFGTGFGYGNQDYGLYLADGGHVDIRGLRMANGGEVDGPGGPVDDKIPAMLSDGEYVVPEDVVRAKGVEFFDKLKEKYHTPAALQRRGIRRV